DRVEIAVLPHVAKIAVTQLDRTPQRLESEIVLLEQRIAAGEVVVGERIGRTQEDQTLVDLQPLGIAATQGQVVAVHAEDVDVVGMAFEDASEEIELEVELALVG